METPTFFFPLTDWWCIINSNNLYLKAPASHACQPCHNLKDLWPFHWGWAFPWSTFKQWCCAHIFTSDRWIHLPYHFLCDITWEALPTFTFLNISKFRSTMTFQCLCSTVYNQQSLLCQHGKEGIWLMLTYRTGTAGETGPGSQVSGNPIKEIMGEC